MNKENNNNYKSWNDFLKEFEALIKSFKETDHQLRSANMVSIKIAEINQEKLNTIINTLQGDKAIYSIFLGLIVEALQRVENQNVKLKAQTRVLENNQAHQTSLALGFGIPSLILLTSLILIFLKVPSKILAKIKGRKNGKLRKAKK